MDKITRWSRGIILKRFFFFVRGTAIVGISAFISADRGTGDRRRLEPSNLRGEGSVIRSY